MIEQEPFCGVRTHFYHNASSCDMFRDRGVVEAKHLVQQRRYVDIGTEMSRLSFQPSLNALGRGLCAVRGSALPISHRSAPHGNLHDSVLGFPSALRPGSSPSPHAVLWSAPHTTLRQIWQKQEKILFASVNFAFMQIVSTAPFP